MTKGGFRRRAPWRLIMSTRSKVESIVVGGVRRPYRPGGADPPRSPIDEAFAVREPGHQIVKNRQRGQDPVPQVDVGVLPTLPRHLLLEPRPGIIERLERRKTTVSEG